MLMECLDNFVIYLDGENHVLDLSNTIPCLAILSPLEC